MKKIFQFHTEDSHTDSFKAGEVGRPPETLMTKRWKINKKNSMQKLTIK